MKRRFAVVLAFALALTGFRAGEMTAFAAEETEGSTSASVKTVEISGSYGQTEARGMLDMVNDFRQGRDGEVWYYDKDEQKVTCSDLGALVYDYNLE